ncbi:hypothetical protein M3Y97_00644800 [Aphelenchoides bicaudatus]|nr:hypothetical protein M3Y97_00644800 [Aphelenchoides bicaudatus]
MLSVRFFLFVLTLMTYSAVAHMPPPKITCGVDINVATCTVCRFDERPVDTALYFAELRQINGSELTTSFSLRVFQTKWRLALDDLVPNVQYAIKFQAIDDTNSDESEWTGVSTFVAADASKQCMKHHMPCSCALSAPFDSASPINSHLIGYGVAVYLIKLMIQF